jgi:hypothetical protein
VLGEGGGALGARTHCPPPPDAVGASAGAEWPGREVSGLVIRGPPGPVVAPWR